MSHMRQGERDGGPRRREAREAWVCEVVTLGFECVLGSVCHLSKPQTQTI